jgi:hypothetical protein
VIAAAFPVASAKYGVPATFSVALVTRDRGRTWAPLPVPRVADKLSFGGFRNRDGGVEAVFATAVPNPEFPAYPDFDATRPLAEISNDAGTSWRAAPLGCPGAGACVTLGPYLQGNCAMNGGTQWWLRSSDGGVRWSMPDLPNWVQPCAEAELVATAPQTALLVNSMSAFPLTRSTDGGASWQDIGLPAAPGEQNPGFGFGARGLTALPDGDLLLSGGQGYRGGWELLRRGNGAWCPVHAVSASLQALPQFSSLTMIGSRLWWLTGGYGRRPSPTTLRSPPSPADERRVHRIVCDRRRGGLGR